MLNLGILDAEMAISIPIFEGRLAHIPRLAIRRRAGRIPWAVVDILDVAHAELFSQFMLMELDWKGMAPQRMPSAGGRRRIRIGHQDDDVKVRSGLRRYGPLVLTSRICFARRTSCHGRVTEKNNEKKSLESRG